MSEEKRVRLLPPAEMLEYLLEVDDDRAVVRGVYPEILHAAGSTTTTIGVANVLWRAVGGYLDTFSPGGADNQVVLDRIRPYLEALVEDPEARQEVHAHLERLSRH